MPDQIQPIKFKKIQEEPSELASNGGQTKPDVWAPSGEELGEGPKRKHQHYSDKKSKQIQRQNFSLEYSYPAVIFDRVCFSVDKSQQQANFLEECIYRAGRTFGPLFGHQQAKSDRTIDILKSVNLSVPCGSIFGLLGPSSCGKTTLLRCLVGLLEPTAGSIRLFGHQLNGCNSDLNLIERLFGCPWGPSSSSRADDEEPAGRSKVPGTSIGYMPQDLGLYEDFTIRQILTMFGRYMRMDANLIATRIDFMAQFLELPNVDRQIESLSGGQKRRVSFAIACLHMPPLIILDEPTVGVDPLLRRSIWKYLRQLADEENRTIIITTHYIEEAAQADQVALMRSGEILVQDTPAKIMKSNGSRTLEEAFLKICNNVQSSDADEKPAKFPAVRLSPQPKMNWSTTTFNTDKAAHFDTLAACQRPSEIEQESALPAVEQAGDTKLDRLKLRAQEKLELFDEIESLRTQSLPRVARARATAVQQQAHFDAFTVRDSPDGANPSMSPDLANVSPKTAKMNMIRELDQVFNQRRGGEQSKRAPPNQTYDCDYGIATKRKAFKLPNRSKLKFNNELDCDSSLSSHTRADQYEAGRRTSSSRRRACFGLNLEKHLKILVALLYKNYRRNVNSLPLLAFQFMLPIVQMISFSLCVGGRPTDIGLGLINHDRPLEFGVQPELLLPLDAGGHNGSSSSPLNSTESVAMSLLSAAAPDELFSETSDSETVELLSLKYLSFIDKSMISIKPYDNLRDALEDVRRAKLWAVMEIGANFSASISQRFNLENFYQLELDTIKQSVIKLYPDKSNKILDMICQRSLVDSYRKFLLSHFEHFKRLPIEVKEPIFDIGANAISNSIDGYTESIAPGLLASLTYIMAAGLTTFIMVVERGAGILERTYTSGVNPVAYLLAHAMFRSFVMMLQIGCVLVLTFYVVRQPLVGSLWLAYLMLMTLNLTGITYGLLISSIVTDQNGAALTIVSSLVVKITLSGILWPLEAIPKWLRTICYCQPLTMPVQALKSIILRGSTVGDRAVNLGFLVSIGWLILFITIAARRFKFYQH